MSLPVIWSDEARAEFYEAEAWYADVSLSLAVRFVQAVEDAMQLIAESPSRFPIVYRWPEARTGAAFSLWTLF